MIIPFKTGIPSRLKEVGFDEKCYFTFTPSNLIKGGKFIHFLNIRQTEISNSKLKTKIAATDYDQVIDFLYEKHRLIVSVSYYAVGAFHKWILEVYKDDNVVFTELCHTRYEALNAGIIEALKLIK